MVGLRAIAVSKKFLPTLGARVLIPALTFIATANAIEMAGMRVFFGDIEPTTMGLNPDEVAKQPADIVLPVHLMGYAADIEKIREVCGVKHKLLVEDAAEAHGTTVEGKKVGTFGLWGAFSFYIAHTVQAGEFGAIVTDSAEIAKVARQLKAHGRECSCKRCTRNTTGCPQIQAGKPDPRFRAEYVGWNLKPMEWSAALARVQLQHVEENMGRRKDNQWKLWHALIGLYESDIEPLPLIGAMVPMAYPIILKRTGYRDRVVSELEQRGVEARPLFGCIPLQQPAYQQQGAEYKGKLPVAEHYGANGFYVGCHQYLTSEQVDRMAQIIRDVITEVVT
jgi:dTDP-4-amino-4,6-dideoxygalactose transaminase